MRRRKLPSKAMNRMDWARYYAARAEKGNAQASQLCWWYLLLNEQALQGE